MSEASMVALLKYKGVWTNHELTDLGKGGWSRFVIPVGCLGRGSLGYIACWGKLCIARLPVEPQLLVLCSLLQHIDSLDRGFQELPRCSELGNLCFNLLSEQVQLHKNDRIILKLLLGRPSGQPNIWSVRGVSLSQMFCMQIDRPRHTDHVLGWPAEQQLKDYPVQ